MTRSRLITLLASAVLLLAAPRLEAAEPCTSKPIPVIYVTPPIAAATVGFSEDLLLAMTNAFREGLWRSYERSGSIKTYQYSDIVAVFGVQTKRQLLGLAGVNFVEAAQGLGAEYVAFLKIGRIAELRVLNVEIFNARSAVVVAAAQEVLASPGAELMTQMKTLAGRRLTGLDCTLRSRRIRPVVPVVTLTLAPTSLLPGAPLTATAVLTDLENGQVQVGKPINFTHVTTRGEEESHWGVFTDFSGFATQALTAGPFVLDSKGKVRASFRREEDNFVTDPVEQLYDVVRPNRNLSVQGTRPKLGPGSADQLAIGLTRNSAPAAGVTVTVSASAGALGAASVVTSSQGSGSVTFTTPSRPGIVEVRASAPGATSNDPPVEDAISFVVDAGIAMSMNAKDTIVSSPSTVTVDLDRDGRALAGATVTFALSGGGFLDAASATTDSAGRAQVVFAAPPQVGASTVTASVTVDGQTISRTVTIAYRDPRDSITREIGEVVLAVQTDPSDANLQRLLTLRNLLRSLGQESRAEQVLDEVDGELYCVHQRADDTCRSGSGLGPVRGTLDLLTGISTGSALLSDLVTRTRDTRRICPYPAFMQGAVYDFAATLRPGLQASKVETGTALLAISAWDGDRPSFLYFEFFQERPNLPTYYVVGGIPLQSQESPFTGTFSDGDLFGYPGNRLLMRDYQARATSPTVRATVNGPNVAGTFDLYLYNDTDANGAETVATASMSATVQYPAPPTYRCGGPQSPPGD